MIAPMTTKRLDLDSHSFQNYDSDPLTVLWGGGTTGNHQFTLDVTNSLATDPELIRGNIMTIRFGDVDSE